MRIIRWSKCNPTRNGIKLVCGLLVYRSKLQHGKYVGNMLYYNFNSIDHVILSFVEKKTGIYFNRKISVPNFGFELEQMEKL